MFLKAVDCSGITKDKFFIANLMKKVIDEIGHEKMVQVVTDNATNCKGASPIIEGLYPTIFWTPCVPHPQPCIEEYMCCKEHREQSIDLSGVQLDHRCC